MTATQIFTVVGLLIDIVGAAVVAFTAFASSHRQAANAGYLQPSNALDRNTFGAVLVAEKCVERNWVRYGVLLLTTGFLFQIAGQLLHIAEPVTWLLVFAVIMLLTLALIFRSNRDFREKALVELSHARLITKAAK